MGKNERNEISPIHETQWRKYLQTRWRMLESWRPDLVRNPDILDMKNWINNEMQKLHNIGVEPTNLTEEKPEDPDKPYWLATLSPYGQVEVIKRSDDRFFNLEGRQIRIVGNDGKVIAEWVQPLIVAREELASIPSPDGNVILPVHGYIGVISDTERNILMSIKQEVASENEASANVVLAIQASVSNISLIREKDPKADKNLETLLKKLSPTGEIDGLLAKPEAVVPAPAEDPNRELKHNLFLLPDPIETGSELHHDLVGNNRYRWCSQAEIDALALTRLTNAHTLSALRTWEALHRRK